MEPLTILAKYHPFQHLTETLIVIGVLSVIFLIVDIPRQRKKKRQRIERLKNKNKNNSPQE